MRVNEIFYSIDGEGVRTGELVVFVRLAGCNLNCSYCDTDYAKLDCEGEELSFNQILEEIKKYNCNKITVTGGEPLKNTAGEELIIRLAKLGYEVNVETNGSYPIDNILNDNVIVTMDYKTTSSGMKDKNILSNIPKLRKTDVLKFVVGTKEDLKDVLEIYENFDISAYIYISPVFNSLAYSEIVQFLKDNNFTNKVRFQVQLHKIIWNPEQRGV